MSAWMATETARSSDIAALLEEERAAVEEEARLDAELDATHREITSLRLSMATVSRISVASTAWARRARQRAATLGIRPAKHTGRAPELEPQPEAEQHLLVHILPTDADRPDWALTSERASIGHLTKERFDLGREAVEQGWIAAVYENQRRSLLGDFSANNLLPGTRGPWSDVDGARAERGRLPHGWYWAVEHRQGQTDTDGWEYAFHFRASWFSQPEREGSFGGAAWVRRRKWVPTQTSRTATPLKLVTPADDIGAGRSPRTSYRCIFEVWEARSLGFVVEGNPDNDSKYAAPPAAVFRIRVGDLCHESAARPPSINPQWGDESNSWRCRWAFRIATPTEILAQAEEEDDVGRLAKHFAGVCGVKVRDRIDLPTLTTYERSFTGKKAVDWLTGAHSRGYHGSGLVGTRHDAITLAQQMMDREIFVVATPNQNVGEVRGHDVTQVFIDSSRAFYRFNAKWLAAKSRGSKIMLRKKSLDGCQKPTVQGHGGVIPEHVIAYCDEIVVELLDAQLAARLGPNDDVRPEQLLGTVAIPLRTVLQHGASEGWHNLTGPGVRSGEVRVGWLVVEDEVHIGYANASQCPSPKHHLKVSARQTAATAAATEKVRDRKGEATLDKTLQVMRSSEQLHLSGEDPMKPSTSAAQASACSRMAENYIDIGDLRSAQTCISAGLGLVPDNAELLEMREHLTQCCSAHIDRTWMPLFQRRLSGGDYRFSKFTQYDRKAPWVTWHGTPHADGGFCDELGFIIPPEFIHDWRVAHSYSLCIAARHRPAWETVIPTAAVSTIQHSRRISSGSSSECQWTGWLPGTADAEAVSDLVMEHGVPPELRRIVWPALVGATQRYQQAVCTGNASIYFSLVERYMTKGEHRTQIRKDIPRTLPGQCTLVNTPEGAQCIERVVGAFSEYDRWYGYTQSLNMVAAHLLVVMSLEAEEEVFWMLTQIVEVVVPEYYSSELYGMNADAVVLSVLAEHWIGSAHTRLATAGVPMTLVASRWLLPLCAEILPPCTLYRLWDVLFLTRSAAPLHAAALTIMRGAHADSFWDFEGAMHVLTQGASAAYDAQPFLEHVTTYMSLLSERKMAALHYECLVNGYTDADGIPMVTSPLEDLAARLPGLDQAMQDAKTSSGYEWDKPEIELDCWQIFRLATPFAEQLDYEAQSSGTNGISVAGACDALGSLLPGLREHPELLNLFVQRVLVTNTTLRDDHVHGHEHDTANRVTLACWLNTLIALQPEANDSPARCSIWWRFCGGGDTSGRTEEGAKGAMMHEVVAVICRMYEALGTPPDDRPRFPTDKAVEASVAAFYTERDKSWLKRSAKRHGLGRRSTAHLIRSQHGLVFEALTWNSPLCLGVSIPPRKPPPSRSAWSLSS